MTKPTRIEQILGIVVVAACMSGMTTIVLADDDDKDEGEQEKAEEQPKEKEKPNYDGRFEVGVFINYSYFDTDAPIRDLMGEDDKISDAWGHGLDLAFNFTPKHAVETNNSWVFTDSEDRRGATHFSIRTRYNILNYRYSMWWGHRWSPFLTIGGGHFRARALDEEHESYGGVLVTGGLGIRYFLSHRASTFVMGQACRINLNPDDATNYVIAWGITAHLGRGPGSFAPPPDGEK